MINEAKRKWLEAVAKKANELKDELTPERIDLILDRADKMLGEYGTAAARGEQWDAYWGDCVAKYVNQPDVYDFTLVFDVDKYEFQAIALGDWIENNGH